MSIKQNIYVNTMLMDHMHGQMTIRYTDGKGNEYEQSGLSVCVAGIKYAPEREKDETFYELTFECVSSLKEHRVREIKTHHWDEIRKLRQLLAKYANHVGANEGVDFLASHYHDNDPDLKEVAKIVDEENAKLLLSQKSDGKTS